MSPEPEINITHNTCTLWHLLLFGIRFSVKIGKAISLQRMVKPLHSPLANAFAIRFSEWQSLWRMHRIRQTQSTTGEKWC